jgi:hypothetical protein
LHTLHELYVTTLSLSIYEGRVDGELRIYHKGNGFPVRLCEKFLC